MKILKRKVNSFLFFHFELYYISQCTLKPVVFNVKNEALMSSFLYFISREIIFITEISIIIKWLLILQSLLIYIVFNQINIQMYVYLIMLTIFLNCYIIPVDTTLNGGTKSGTEVSSFNTYLVCVSFFLRLLIDLNSDYVSRGTQYWLSNYYYYVPRET